MKEQTVEFYESLVNAEIQKYREAIIYEGYSVGAQVKIKETGRLGFIKALDWEDGHFWFTVLDIDSPSEFEYLGQDIELANKCMEGNKHVND